jgi:arylsulfatase
MVEESPNPLSPSRRNGRKPISLFIILMTSICFSILAAFLIQLNIVSIDNDGSIAVDFGGLIHTMITRDDENYMKQFGSDNERNPVYYDDNIDGNEYNNANDDDYSDDKTKVKNDDDGDDDGEARNEQTEQPEQPEQPEQSDHTKKKTILNPTPRQQLNVLILYPDDWRHDSIGAEKPYVLTPFLDQLAREGIRFTHNAVTTSVCWMSRATLWMGQYSSTHKSYKLKCPRFGTAENWEHSWIKILQNAGYFIGHIGKWQFYTRDTAKYFDWSRLFEGHHWETIRGERIHAADLAKNYADNFFDTRPKDKPFVLSVAFYPPKPVGDGRAPGGQWSPTNETRVLYENVTIPRPEHIESYQNLPKFLHKGPAVGRFGQRYPDDEHFQASMRNYYALVTGVDKACKGIVDRLKEEGLYNNTMIIFTTDNGMFHGAHGLAGKWYPYQESIRVPLIIYDPRMPDDKVGILDDSFTLNVDLAHTILGAAGVAPDENMEGRDISDLYLPNVANDYHDSNSVEIQPWREEFFYEFPSPEEVYIPSSTALVRKDWKYIYWVQHDREQLFDLKNDPLELNDLYKKKIDNRLKPVLDEMRKRHGELANYIFDYSYINDTEPCVKFQKELWSGV